jgi:hypothetical protein
MIIIERWKDIEGTNGRYEISNKGRVWSNVSDKYLAAHPNGQGYLHVLIYWPDSSRSTKKIHKLVAQHFLAKPRDKSKSQINHKDGNKLNNHVSNLEWCDGSHNTQHAYDIGLSEGRPGERHSMAKLTEREAQEILNLTTHHHYRGIYSDLAESYGVGRQQIARIAKGQRWSYLKPQKRP